MAGVQNKTTIAYCTDAEGNKHYFNEWLKYVPHLMKKVGEGVNSKLEFVDPNAKFVYGGDVCDKGPGNIEIVRQLSDFKRRYPDRVVLILGNRDLNKMRMTSELDAKIIKERWQTTPGPYWVKETQRVSPRDFLVKAIIANEEYDHDNDPSTPAITYEESQITEDLYTKWNTRANRVKWMLNDTMGAVGDFDRRRQELAEITGKPESEITEEMVGDSYYQWVQPNVDPAKRGGLVGEEGEMADFLALGQLAHIDMDTRTLFVHGGLQKGAFGYVPEHPTRIEDVFEWVKKLNEWGAKEVKEWLAKPKWRPNGEDQAFPASNKHEDDWDWKTRGGNRLIAYVAPLSEPSVVINNMFSPKNNIQHPDPAIASALLSAGIHRVITGHQPHGHSPSVYNASELQLVDADTGYSDMKAPDNRGAAVSAVHFTDSLLSVEGRLPDNRPIKYTVSNNAAVAGDPCVGRPRSEVEDDGWWVKCKLFDEKNPSSQRYVLQKVDGFKVEYQEIDAADLPSARRVTDAQGREARVVCHNTDEFQSSQPKIKEWLDTQSPGSSFEVRVKAVEKKGPTVDAVDVTVLHRQKSRDDQMKTEVVEQSFKLLSDAVSAVVLMVLRDTKTRDRHAVYMRGRVLSAANTNTDETYNYLPRGGVSHGHFHGHDFEQLDQHHLNVHEMPLVHLHKEVFGDANQPIYVSPFHHNGTVTVFAVEKDATPEQLAALRDQPFAGETTVGVCPFEKLGSLCPDLYTWAALALFAQYKKQLGHALNQKFVATKGEAASE